MAQTRTPAEELGLLLNPPTTQGQIAVDNDPDLRRLSVAYKIALQKPTQHDINIALGPIIQELNERGSFTHSPDVVFRSLESRPFEQTTEQPTEASKETLPPKGLDLSTLLPPKNTVSGEGKIKPADTLRDMQEKKAVGSFQSLLTSGEFQKLLTSSGGNDEQLIDAIDKFYAQHFDAQTLLGHQYDMVRKHALNLPGLSEQKDRVAAFDEKRALQEAFLKKIKTTPENELTQEERRWKKAQEDREAYAKIIKKSMLREVRPLQQDPKNAKLLESVQKRTSPLAHNAFASEWGLVNNWALSGISDIFPGFNYRAFGDSLLEEGGQLTSTTVVVPQQQASEPEALIRQQGQGQRKTGPSGISHGLREAERLGGRGVRAAKRSLEKKALKTGVKLAGRSAFSALFTNPWTWIILLIVLLAFLLIFLIVFLVSKIASSGTAAPTPTPTIVGNPLGGGGTCSGADCKKFLENMGIFTSGAQGLNGDPYGRVKLLYEILSKAMQSPSAYGTYLGLPGKTLSVDFSNGGCTGFASGRGFLFLNGFGSCGTAVAQFMALHELSHIIAFRNPSLYNKFLNTISYSRMRALPTYNCQLDYGPHGPYPGECFADMVAENVVYSYYRNTVGGRPGYYTGRTFPNYPTTFSDFYNFAGTNIYKGRTF